MMSDVTDFGSEPGSAEQLISVLWTFHGEDASNAAIWFLLQGDTDDVRVFLVYMEKLCNFDVVTTCAQFLRDHDVMPVLSEASIHKLLTFDESDFGGEWP
jgi:hypothetical protein